MGDCTPYATSYIFCRKRKEAGLAPASFFTVRVLEFPGGYVAFRSVAVILIEPLFIYHLQ